MGIYKLVQLRLKACHNLKRRIYVFLIYAKAVPLKVNASSKRHHPVIYFASMVARQKFIALLSSDKRSGVKNEGGGI